MLSLFAQLNVLQTRMLFFSMENRRWILQWPHFSSPQNNLYK